MRRMFIEPTEAPLLMLMPPPRLWVRLTTLWAQPETASTTAAAAQITAYPTLPAISDPPLLPSNLVLLRLIVHRSWRGYRVGARPGCRMTPLRRLSPSRKPSRGQAPPPGPPADNHFQRCE